MINVITFPDEEYNSYKKRLDDDLIIYTTRVSDEVSKYKMDKEYDSCFGKLKVVYLEHFDNLDEHPFIAELTVAQKNEISTYILEKGFDLIGLKKI